MLGFSGVSLGIGAIPAQVFLRLSTAVLIGIMIVVVWILYRAGIAVAVAIISRARVAIIDRADRIEDHYEVVDTRATLTHAQVHIDVGLILRIMLATNSQKITSRLAQLNVELASGIEQ